MLTEDGERRKRVVGRSVRGEGDDGEDTGVGRGEEVEEEGEEEKGGAEEECGVAEGGSLRNAKSLERIEAARRAARRF